ncbi:RNI-like protein [Testicularia cyperi]|uniref:RNI-like protein n=1 Tax=Testicularia cyperi TaxID=1882483 RepID=A0A317Y1F1_9BASI|nr:RNI-like protein [Testicularia cyperi]
MTLMLCRRVSLGPHRGTVRYYGPVAPAKGDWLGIEWDDPLRGKHDGVSADGTRYFDVRKSGSGSFIRTTASKLSCGCSFLQALRNKYLPETPSVGSTASAKEDEVKQQHSRKNLAEIEIEAPNMESVMRRAARLDRLREVGLGGWKTSGRNSVEPGSMTDASQEAYFEVARAFAKDGSESVGAIRQTCPNIRWLDLSRSLLPDWEEVSLIAGDLDRLDTLLLHLNRLSPPTSPIPESWAQRFESLRDLRLDGTLISWSEMLSLAPALSNLEHLQLGSNEISNLHSSTAAVLIEFQPFPRLTSLSLEDNQIESFEEVARATSVLRSLETLNLIGNRLSHIPAAPADAIIHPKLRELHLSSNPIASWSDLEHLDTWMHGRDKGGLKALHIKSLDEHDFGDREDDATHSARSPLLARYEYRDFRAIAIARLPQLRVLDHTDVSAKERSDAELFVYSRFRDNDSTVIHGRLVSAEAKGDSKTLSFSQKLLLFPRYAELAFRFDGVAKDTDQDTDGHKRAEQESKKDTLRAKLVRVTVHAASEPPSASPPHLTPNRSGEAHVLASTPLRLAKMKLAKIVGVKPSQITQMWAFLGERSSHHATDTASESVDPSSTPAANKRIVFEMEDLSRDLNWYEVGQGDEVVLVAAV